MSETKHEMSFGFQNEETTVRGNTVMRVVAAAAGTYVILWVVAALLTRNPYRSYGQLLNAELATFLGTLLFCIALCQRNGFAHSLAVGLNRFAEWLSKRGAITSNPALEAPKFAFIRIVFGAVLTIRAFWILYYLQPSDWASFVVWPLVMAQFICSVCVMCGLATQFVFAYLVIVQWTVGDWVLGTYTLGNYIAAMLALLLAFANAGAYHSIDAILLKRRNRRATLIQLTYYADHLPSRNALQVAKFLALFMYWCVCLYSLAMHLGEPAWMTGTAGPLLLSNKFMSVFGAEFQEFFELGGWAVMFGRIALWAMLPWYLLLLPCVLRGGILRAYAMTWAILFFLLSEFILQLGSLALIEFLLLAGLFWCSPFIEGRHKLQVFYDDRCNLCDRTVRIVQAVDWFHRVQIRPVSKSRAALDGFKIDFADAMLDLHAVDVSDGGARIAKGYEFYLLLAKRVLLLAPFYPVLVFGRYLGGPQLYRAIADRRIRWFGKCQFPTVKVTEPKTRPTVAQGAITTRDPLLVIAFHVALLAGAYLVSIPAPYLGWTEAGIALQGRNNFGADDFADAAFFYGMGPINVFNRDDLHLADNWFTLSSIANDGTERLLPIFSSDGRRLQMHRSDLVYFGYTLRFRRDAIGKKGCLFDQYRSTFDYLAESARRSSADGGIVYKQYHQELPSDTALTAGLYKANPSSIVCTVRF